VGVDPTRGASLLTSCTSFSIQQSSSAYLR
jgi:hypothetical protein